MTKTRYGLIQSKFPSPYGDYGSYQLCRELGLKQQTFKFPSPYGDYGSYHAEREKKIAWYEN